MIHFVLILQTVLSMFCAQCFPIFSCIFILPFISLFQSLLLLGHQYISADVTTWKCVPCCWPIVMETHQPTVDSHHKGPVIWSFDIFFVVSLNHLLNKLSNCRWFEISWCLCDITWTKWSQFCKQYFQMLWGRMTHTCVSKLTIIGSDNGLSPGRRQAIIWPNAGILLIGPLGTNFNEILIEIYTFSFKKTHFEMFSGK